MSTENILLTGYVYDKDFYFKSTYEFPNNMDKDEVHLPPNTTLTPIPLKVADTKIPQWIPEQGKWKVVDNPNYEAPHVPVGISEEHLNVLPQVEHLFVAHENVPSEVPEGQAVQWDATANTWELVAAINTK